MSKNTLQKKIKVNPYLNERIKPQPVVDHDKFGNELKEEAYPLYYQVVYDKKNTHVKSTFGKYYSSLDKPTILNDDPVETIDFERRNIERIIRHMETIDSEFSVMDLSKIFPANLKSIHEIVRFKSKKLMVQRLLKENPNYPDMLNYNSDAVGSILFLQTIEKIADLNNLFTAEELHSLRNLKQFDYIYLKNMGQGPGIEFLLKNNPTYLPVKKNDYPTMISWKSGEAQNQIKRLIYKNGEEKTVDPVELIKDINWMLNLTLAEKP